MFNEKDLRKQNVDPENCIPVVLADGQPWLFPRVWLSLRPVFKGGKATEMRLTSSIGTEFDAMKQAVEDAALSEEGNWPLAAANLAAFLLEKNYDITDEALSEILVFPTSGEHAYELLRTIMDVAHGRTDPKELTPTGSDAPS